MLRGRDGQGLPGRDPAGSQPSPCLLHLSPSPINKTGEEYPGGFLYYVADGYLLWWEVSRMINLIAHDCSQHHLFLVYALFSLSMFSAQACVPNSQTPGPGALFPPLSRPCNANSVKTAEGEIFRCLESSCKTLPSFPFCSFAEDTAG